MRIVFYIMFGIVLAMLADNQIAVMTGDFDDLNRALMGYAGVAFPFFLIGIAYGAGRWGS